MYTEIYYWIYHHLSKVKTNDHPAFNSCLAVVLLQGLNIICIGKSIDYATFFVLEKEQVTFLGIALSLFLIAFNYFYLFKRRDKIFKEISEFSAKRLKRSKIVYQIYILASLLVFLFMVVYYN